MPPSSCKQSARKGTVNKASGPSSDIQHRQSSAKAVRSINCMSCTSSVWHLGHERNGGASWLVRTRLCTSISDSVDANARGRTSAVASANSRMEHNDMPFAHEWTMDRSRVMIELNATHRNEHDPAPVRARPWLRLHSGQPDVPLRRIFIAQSSCITATAFGSS